MRLEGSIKIDTNYFAKQKFTEINKQPLHPIAKIPTEQISPQEQHRNTNFSNYNAIIANEQVSSFSKESLSVLKASLDPNFIHNHNDIPTTMRNLMPYEIVETSDNTDDDDLKISDGRENNQPSDSRKPSLHQILALRRRQAESYKKI